MVGSMLFVCVSIFIYQSQTALSSQCHNKKANLARITHYTSYPKCCDNKKLKDQSECDDYSGCKWKGQFACLNKPKSRNWVENNDIVAFYDDSDPNGTNFHANYCNKQIRLSKLMKNGTTVFFIGTIYDTCGNTDCNGCCKTNSLNGKLVDVEVNTALRHFGRLDEVGFSEIKYELL